MFELVVKLGLWIACGMVACVVCILNDKKENGYSTITIIDIIVVAGGPISLFIVGVVGLSKITVKV